MTQHTIKIETELSRDLGLVSALAIGVGTMVAAGIFTLSGLAIRNVGSAAILSFLLAAIVATFTALTYCEFVSIYPESGEGYLYARKTFAPPIAYFVGWSLFLGYTSSCAFYIASLSSYFNEFIWHSPITGLSGLSALVCLTLLNIKGTKESGRFQVVVTIGKVILLFWFVAGGISSVNTADIISRFSTDVVKIGGTAAMVFITFFGFSAIAASAGEVKNPVKTIPRAIFISMGIVTILYTLVVLVIIAAGLTEYTEAAMGTAARRFLGPAGGMVIVAGALFSMISASNASIMAGSRITLAMSRLGHFPKEFGTVNPRTRTPIISTLLVGGTISIFSVSLRLEDLAHFADTVLLLSLVTVNAALIYHRRKFPDIERPFRVALVPLLPALGIIANLYLLSQIFHHPLPVILASCALLLGMIGFTAWKGVQAEEQVIPGPSSHVALGRYATSEGRFKILVPLANPANVTQLIALAAAIAKDREGEIIALRVAVVPEQMPYAPQTSYLDSESEVLELAHNEAQKHGVPITSLVRVGHHPGRAILETSRERRCDLIILGWKGYTTTAEKLLGEMTETVITNARTDIMLVKLTGAESFADILLPTAGGKHARRAEEYASSIVRFNTGVLGICSVGSTDSTEKEVDQISNRLDEVEARMLEGKDLDIKKTIIYNDSVVQGLIDEAQNYDALMVGATGKSFRPKVLFGTIPENIAKHSDRPVIVVKHYQPVKALIRRLLED